MPQDRAADRGPFRPGRAAAYIARFDTGGGALRRR
jgi:hypothetical protein